MVICEGVTNSGVRYKIDDALMVRDEQKRAVEEAQQQAAYNILVAYDELKGAK